MARLKFEGTLTDLISHYQEVEIDRVEEWQSQIKTSQDTQRPAKTPKDTLTLTHEGDRSCGYTNRSYFVYSLDDIKDLLAEAAEDIGVDEISEDWLEEIISDNLYQYEDCHDDEVIYITDGYDIIKEECTNEELENTLTEMASDDRLICYEDQWYRGWGFTATIELPNDRKRGQIHSLDCEVEFGDWGDAHPAGMGVDWSHHYSEAFMKKCFEYIVSLKIQEILDEVKDLDLDLDVNLNL